LKTKMFEKLIKNSQKALFMLTRFRVYILKKPSLQNILEAPENIVLTRLEDVGDMLVFVPTLRAFRQGFPQSRIYLVTRSQIGFETIDGCPYVDEFIHMENTFSGKLKLIKRLRKIKPDIFVISTQCWGRVKWGFWGKAKVIVGHTSSPLFNRERKVKLAGFIMISPEYDRGANEVENNLKLARVLGIKHASQQMEYSWISPDAEKYVNALFDEYRLDQKRPLVALAPGSKRRAKMWYVDEFARVADELIERYGARIVITGAKQDEALTAQIKSKMKHDAVSLAGKINFKQLPVLIRKVDLLITVDSGPMHFAAAVGTPYIALFGPGEYIKWRHDRQPEKQKNIYKQPPCAPCNKEFCEDHKCMKMITGEDVLAQVKELIGNNQYLAQLRSKII
jgi:heptosyltransferase-2